MHDDGSGAWILREVGGAGGELDAAGIFLQGAGDGFKPERSLEPPVAEEFGVKGRAEDGRCGLGEAGLECVVHERDKVRGVALDAGLGVMRVVGFLAFHVDVRAGDAPVAMAARPAFLVEVAVVAVAGIAEVAGPDL